ncbi:MAG TPA: putative porin [Verrucomicrobiae bacterium]|nr:putative porin [Verrucomicrobiae bacterium]
MKNPKSPKYIFGKALLAGAAMLTLTNHARAQSADALIDKLVEKGILSVREAQDLRDEADKNFSTAVQSKLGMPDWVTGYKISGDFRARYDHLSSDNAAFAERERFRYRLRFGITVNMLDNLEAGFRLASGDPKGAAGNSLSANSTLQDNFSKKNIYIDTAYGKWTPVNSGGWLVSATAGKMDNPFSFTPMVFDPDLTPEGAVVQSSWVINDKHSLSLTGGAFVLDEEQYSANDPFMYGGQFLWNAKWTEKFSTSLGAGAFKIVGGGQLNTANVPYINQGNTRKLVNEAVPPNNTVQALYVLQDQFAPVILDASATYTLNSFPLYNGTFPIKVGGEFMQNTEANKNNQGFWAGVTFGKSGTKKTWDITYRYERLEADAWYDQLVDDDNGAFYPGDVPTSNSTFGYFGGTNIKGHMIKFNYSFTDSLTFTATCFINDLISHDGILGDPLVADGKTSATFHFMADVMWKF